MSLAATFTHDMRFGDRWAARSQLGRLGFDASKQSVTAFQRQRGIAADGIIGPQTRGQLQQATAERERSRIDPNLRVVGERKAPSVEDRNKSPAGTLPARDYQSRYNNPKERAAGAGPAEPKPSASEREKYDKYAAMIRNAGGTINKNGATVLGIRARDGVTNKFEDKIAVLSPNGRVREFEASTRPSGTTERGVAELKPGNYKVEPHRPHYDRPSWQVTTQNGNGNVPVYRDSNRDGQYSAAEKATPRTGDGILFHVPNPKYGDRIPTSIGCLNIRNRDWNAFTDAIGGAKRSFNFTLVDR